MHRHWARATARASDAQASDATLDVLLRACIRLECQTRLSNGHGGIAVVTLLTVNRFSCVLPELTALDQSPRPAPDSLPCIIASMSSTLSSMQTQSRSRCSRACRDMQQSEHREIVSKRTESDSALAESNSCSDALWVGGQRVLDALRYVSHYSSTSTALSRLKKCTYTF